MSSISSGLYRQVEQRSGRAACMFKYTTYPWPTVVEFLPHTGFPLATSRGDYLSPASTVNKS